MMVILPLKKFRAPHEGQKQIAVLTIEQNLKIDFHISVLLISLNHL